jgi:exopolysaccharide biosynthesis polyprenyl glycosylphosphotransferase
MSVGRREVGIVVSEGAIQRLPEEGGAAHELPAYEGNGAARSDPIGPTEATRAARAARRRGAMLRRLLALADFAAIALALWVAYYLVMDASASALLWVALFGPVWILVVKLHGLYDQDHRRIRHSTLDELRGLLSASIIGTVAIAALTHVVSAPDFTEAGLVALAAVTFAAAVLLRGGTRLMWHALGPEERSALVGSGRAMSRLNRRIATHPEVHLAVAGYFSVPAGAEGSGNGAAGNGDSAAAPYLGPVSDLLEVAEEQGIERVLVAEESISGEQLRRLIDDCKRGGLSLTLVAPHAGLLGPGIQLTRLGELPLLDFGFSDPPRSTEMLKRAMDIFISGLLLVVLAPLFVAIAAAIKLDSRGPVLFRQVRIGKDGRSFTMVKFRTMVSGAERRLDEVVDTSSLPEPSFKIPDDPRHTRVGRRLRRFSADELPQLWNVLRGEMSLVGPRPEEEAVVRLYDEAQRVRLLVKPGLTGPMQVYGRGDLGFDERLALERDYIDNLSITQDIAILLRTPRAVIGGNGAY